MKTTNGEVIRALSVATNNAPSERVCQLIFNALDAQGLARHPDGSPKDLFYTENSVLLHALWCYGGET